MAKNDQKGIPENLDPSLTTGLYTCRLCNKRDRFIWNKRSQLECRHCGKGLPLDG